MRFVSRHKAHVCWFAIAGLGALYAGCNKPSAPPDGPDGPDGRDGGAGTSTAGCTPVNERPGPLAVGPDLTNEELAVSFTSIQGTLQARTAIAEPQADAEAIRAAMQGAPHVADTGIAADCSVWIRFTDGTPLSIINDRRGVARGDPHPLDEPAAMAAASTGVGQATEARAPAATATAFAIPASANARVGHTDNLSPHALVDIGAALHKRGYLVATGADAADLTDGIVGLGVLWLSTHGVIEFDAQGNDHYVIATTVAFDAKTWACTPSQKGCPLDAADRKGGRYIATYNGSHVYFGVNEAWVATHWSFASDSVVVIDACNSLTDLPAINAFRGALKKAGAGTVLGWRGFVNIEFAERAMTFLFDRLLGGDRERLTPPQRPFSVAEVLAAMEPAGLIRDRATGATLGREHYSDAEPILAPSIQNLTVVEKPADAELTLVGEFPAQPGTLKIGGTTVSATWGSSQIVATIPHAGPGSSGAVEVEVARDGQAITGNQVPLTSWRGSYRVRYIPIGVFGPPGPYAELSCTALHFRGDVHRYRLKPEEAAHGGSILPSGERTPFVSFINVTADSRCNGATGGAGEKPIGEVRWAWESPSSPLPWVDNQAPSKPDAWFFGIPTVDTSTRRLRLIPDAFMPTTQTVTVLQPEPPRVVSTTPNMTVGVSPVIPTLHTRWIQLDATTLGASQATTMFNLVPAPSDDACEQEYDLMVEPGSAPTSATEG